MEGENVNKVPSAHSHPVQLTPIQDNTIGEFNTMPMWSAPHSTQIPLSYQHLDAPFDSLCPQKYNSEGFSPPNHAIPSQCSCSPTLASTNDARGSWNLEDDVTPFQYITQARTSTGSQPLSTESQPSSTEPQPSSKGSQPSSTAFQPSSRRLRPSMVLQPSTALCLSSTALWPTSTVPYTPDSTPNLHFGLTIPLPHLILIPHLFTNGIPRTLARFSSKGQHPHHSIPPVPFRSLSTAQKHPLEAQPRPLLVHSPTHSHSQPQHFESSPVCLPTPPLQ